MDEGEGEGKGDGAGEGEGKGDGAGEGKGKGDGAGEGEGKGDAAGEGEGGWRREGGSESGRLCCAAVSLWCWGRGPMLFRRGSTVAGTSGSQQQRGRGQEVELARVHIADGKACRWSLKGRTKDEGLSESTSDIPTQ